METEVEDRIFDDFVIMINFLEIVKSSFFDEIVSLNSVNRVEERNLESKDVDS